MEEGMEQTNASESAEVRGITTCLWQNEDADSRYVFHLKVSSL